MTERPDDVDTIGDAAFVVGVEELTVEELRDRWRRASLLRRSLAGRLEAIAAHLAVVVSERHRRRGETPPRAASSAPDGPAGEDQAAALQAFDLAELAAAERRLREDAARLVNDRSVVQRACDTLGSEIGRRYRLGLTSTDDMLRG